MKNKLKKNLKIAVQKDGRLTEDTLNLLSGISLDFESYKRQLYINCKNFPASILFSRDDDIPEFVESGTADVGIVGLDVYKEKGLNSNSKIISNLNFGKCKLSLAVKINSKFKSLADLQGKRIATSFPKITKSYLKQNGIEAEVITLSGGVEIAPSLNLSDGIVDLVSSGFTLKMNGLMEIETILQVNSVIIYNKNISREKKAYLDQILNRITSLEEAKVYKYIMFNLPKNKIDLVSEIVPGLKAPTITSLTDPNWLSVQTVVKEEFFWEKIENLKAIGARDILVLPIEKIIK